MNKEFYEILGVKPIPIRIEKAEDVLTGENLEKALNIIRANQKHRQEHLDDEDGGCHYNSGMMLYEDFEGWDITFCEGELYVLDNLPIAHCWNCFTKIETGEKHYLDFTLNKALNAELIANWGSTDILYLFDETGMAFVPHTNFWQYTEYVDVFKEYYPNLNKNAEEE